MNRTRLAGTWGWLVVVPWAKETSPPTPGGPGSTSSGTQSGSSTTGNPSTGASGSGTGGGATGSGAGGSSTGDAGAAGGTGSGTAGGGTGGSGTGGAADSGATGGSSMTDASTRDAIAPGGCSDNGPNPTPKAPFMPAQPIDTKFPFSTHWMGMFADNPANAHCISMTSLTDLDKDG